MTERLGNWLQTFTGRRFYPRDPRADDIDVGDIAHALSLVCRFGGHVPRFYSVAEHSVRVCVAVNAAGGSPVECRWALLHDAAEAYIGDVVWPLKASPEMNGYGAIELNVERAVCVRFGLPPTMPAIVKHFDMVLLATEKRDVVSHVTEAMAHKLGDASARGHAWNCDSFAPLADRIRPMRPDEAEAYFLRYFEALWSPEAA